MFFGLLFLAKNAEHAPRTLDNFGPMRDKSLFSEYEKFSDRSPGADSNKLLSFHFVHGLSVHRKGTKNLVYIETKIHLFFLQIFVNGPKMDILGFRLRTLYKIARNSKKFLFM